ncbi:m-AAA protease-interacting protein 1, mitochondrial-like isoform X2 [Rhodnius prolixus]
MLKTKVGVQSSKCLKEVLGVCVQKKDDIARNQSKWLHQDSRDSQHKNSDSSTAISKPLPRLLYMQNPVVWLANKLDFRYLKNWDPNFSESEFTRGARQAVSTITDLLSKNMFDALKPLLTNGALLSLRKDVEILWADEVRRNIALTPDDVRLLIPRKLHFRNISENKFCDIDMVCFGQKWLEVYGLNQNPPLMFTEIIVRFHRNYTEGIKPDWTISAFKVLRFNIVHQRNRRKKIS